MSLNDKDIIASRISTQNSQRNSIDNFVKIDDITYSFSVREFPPYFSLVLPTEFRDLALEYACIKFPYENRPKNIITSELTTVCFAFDYGAKPNSSLEDRQTQYKSVIKRLHPTNVFFASFFEDAAQGYRVACYDYRSMALDGDIYNLSFFTDLPQGELFGWFTCPIESQNKWEPLVRQMIQTIKPLQPLG